MLTNFKIVWKNTKFNLQYIVEIQSIFIDISIMNFYNQTIFSRRRVIFRHPLKKMFGLYKFITKILMLRCIENKEYIFNF